MPSVRTTCLAVLLVIALFVLSCAQAQTNDTTVGGTTVVLSSASSTTVADSSSTAVADSSTASASSTAAADSSTASASSTAAADSTTIFAAASSTTAATTNSSTTVAASTSVGTSTTGSTNSSTTSSPTPTPTPTHTPKPTPKPTPTPNPLIPVPQPPSAQCLEGLGAVEQNPEVEALMFDATGKALDDLGKWDECRDIGSIAQYCTITFGTPLPIPAPMIGLCIPSACNATDFEAILYGILYAEYGHPKSAEIGKLANLTMELILYNMYKVPGTYHFHCIGDTPPVGKSLGSVVMVTISFMLVGLVAFGTLLDGWDAHWWPEKSGESSTGSIQDDGEVKSLLHKSNKHKPKWFDFLVAFSVVRNFKSLIGPSPPALAFLNGMRAISIMWVILGHSLDYMNYAGVSNFVHVVTRDVLKTSAQVFPAAEFSVDSFFWLSGFLVTYLSVNEIKTAKHLALYYFHRVWRLSPAYYFALFFYMYISVHMGNGPLWPKYEYMVESTCEPYWWTNILYVNNFLPANNWNGQCFLWGWYLAVDMQLYIVAPVLFLLYKWNKTVGWSLVIALVVACVVINGAITHVHDLQWNALNPHTYMSLIYGKPYTRATPWLLGILCGFMYLEKRRMTPIVAYVGWVISGTVMMLTVYGPVTQFSVPDSEFAGPKNNWVGDKNINNFLYFTFSKLAWSLALSFIMYSMAAGYGGFVRRFLGAPMWNPLARLTYSTYLFHPIIMFVVYYSNLQYFSYDNYIFSIIYVGIVFLAFCVGGVVFLALERPMVNMEKLFLPHKKRT